MGIIDSIVVYFLVPAALIGILVLCFAVTRKDDTKKMPRGEVLYRSRTTVIRQGRKVKVIKEYLDNDDRWEI